MVSPPPLLPPVIDSADANHQFPKAVLNKFADECTVEAYDPEVMKAASLNAINKCVTHSRVSPFSTPRSPNSLAHS